MPRPLVNSYFAFGGGGARRARPNIAAPPDGIDDDALRAEIRQLILEELRAIQRGGQ